VPSGAAATPRTGDLKAKTMVRKLGLAEYRPVEAKTLRAMSPDDRRRSLLLKVRA
jgi:hypothetical protein